MANKLQIAFKMLFLGICVFIAFGGHYPPAYSQGDQRQFRSQQVPVVTTEDAMQDHDIDGINHHLETTDARVQKQWDAINKNALDISAMQAEERTFTAVLGLLSSAGIFLQVRRKPA